jgi:negative regulator of replication initiation
MRRIQLYFDDDLWDVLRTQARKDGTSISDLLRRAVRERYLGSLEKRREAMRAIVGIRKDIPESVDSTEYVRSLRRNKRTLLRLERLANKWLPAALMGLPCPTSVA